MKTKKIQYLDGLRGICCFIVIIDHNINFLKEDIRYTNLQGFEGLIRKIISLSPLNIFYSGISSVCIFFILSGFVLSIKYHEKKDRTLLVDGVIKRYPRLIFPVLSSMIFMYVSLLTLDKVINTSFNLSFTSSIYQSLYLIPFSHFDFTNYPLWTISIELFGSYIIFGLLSLFSNEKKEMLLYFLVFSFFYLTNSYYYLFIAGVILCKLKDSKLTRPTKEIRFIFFVFGIFLITTPYQRNNVDLYSGIYSYLSFTKNIIDYKELYLFLVKNGSLMVFYSILNSKLAIKILDIKIFSFLGKISFPLYLTHAVVLKIATALIIYYSIIPTMKNYLIEMIILIPIYILISIIFERFIDIPSIKLSSRISKLIVKR